MADAIDIEDRADHLDKVFGALSVYVTVILDDMSPADLTFAMPRGSSPTSDPT
jgi:hypothetical protein